jgi:transcription elongation factor Elf1
MPLMDVQCKHCGFQGDVMNVYVPLREGKLEYPVCGVCGHTTEFLVPESPPATDVLGVEVRDEILDVTYSSTRDRDRKMRDRGWDPCGDKQGGARNEDIAKWQRTRPAYSYASQDRRG